MKSFLQEFLRDDPGRKGRQIYLGAFGKHPGWDDHIDDLGLETESLVAAKHLMYVTGIGGQIGRWEQLDWPAQVEFNHLFLWKRESQMLIGRLWASRDGKKRTKYPMVVCAHCSGATLPLVQETLLAWLEELKTRATATNAASDIREMMTQFRDSLREWLAGAQEEAAPVFEAESFFREIDFENEGDGLARSLWKLRESKFAIGKYKARYGLAPEHFRLPALPVPAGRGLALWERVFHSQFDPTIPVLFLRPLDQYWLDVIAGEPTSADLFCFRASPRAVPLSGDSVTEIPDGFREETRGVFAHAAGGEPVPAKNEGSWMGRLFGR